MTASSASFKKLYVLCNQEYIHTYSSTTKKKKKNIYIQGKEKRKIKAMPNAVLKTKQHLYRVIIYWLSLHVPTSILNSFFSLRETGNAIEPQNF